MSFKGLRALFKPALLLASVIVLTGSVRPSQLEIVKMSGSLTVVTRNSPTTYYEDRSGPTGFEYEFAKAFADYLGVELELQVADNSQDIFRTLDRGQAAFAAAGLTRTAEREQKMRFTQPYKHTEELVIYRRGNLKPVNLDELSQGKLLVRQGSNHAETLHTWQNTEYPSLSWSESSEVETFDLLQLVTQGELDYTLINANEFQMMQAYYPELDIAFSLNQHTEIAWAFPLQTDDSLLQLANQFIQSQAGEELLAQLSERYYGHLDRLDYVGAQRFLRQTYRKLDIYKDNFQQAAEQHGFDWRLLAAVGYQESHWNPKAKSFTGVRGMMMLTLPTAKELGVKNRLNAEQSIQGGALYLARLRERLQEVAEPDRTWLALAAYNVGFGHLTDARKITELTGGDPNAWISVKQALPLLSQKRYYKHTRHGYARGHEPVNYVQNIRRYYDVLVWNDEQSLPNIENIALSALTVPPLL